VAARKKAKLIAHTAEFMVRRKRRFTKARTVIGVRIRESIFSPFHFIDMDK